MQPFAPEHLARLTGIGPWARVHYAALRSTMAHMNSGKLCGYDYDWPTSIEYRDGKWQPGKVRPFMRMHDCLPMHALAHDAQRRMVMEYAITQNIKNNMSGVEFAHWGDQPGFAGRQTSDSFDHHCHADHFRELDRPLWLRWLDAFREHVESGKWAARKLPVGRAWHSMFYRIWLAQFAGDIGGYWVDKFLSYSADAFLAVPLVQHGDWYFHALFPYAMWRYCGERGSIAERCHDWLISGANAAVETRWPLVLSAIAYWITSDKSHLERQAPALAAWPGRCYREIGSPIDQYWMPQYPPTVQVPFFLAACNAAGVVPPTKLPVGGLPVAPALQNRAVALFDRPPTRVTVTIRSFGTDAHGGDLTWTDHDGSTVYENLPNVPGREWNRYAKTPPPNVAKLDVHPLTTQQVEIESDAPYRIELKAGERYIVGQCRGTLDGFGAIAFAVDDPPGTWLNLTFGGDQPRGLFAGYSRPGTKLLSQDGFGADANPRMVIVTGQPTLIELAGHDYAKCTMVCRGMVYRPDQW